MLWICSTTCCYLEWNTKNIVIGTWNRKDCSTEFNSVTPDTQERDLELGMLQKLKPCDGIRLSFSRLVWTLLCKFHPGMCRIPLLFSNIVFEKYWDLYKSIPLFTDWFKPQNLKFDESCFSKISTFAVWFLQWMALVMPSDWLESYFKPKIRLS